MFFLFVCFKLGEIFLTLLLMNTDTHINIICIFKRVYFYYEHLRGKRLTADS